MGTADGEGTCCRAAVLVYSTIARMRQPTAWLHSVQSVLAPQLFTRPVSVPEQWVRAVAMLLQPAEPESAHHMAQQQSQGQSGTHVKLCSAPDGACATHC
jgi:hypothetical protein